MPVLKLVSLNIQNLKKIFEREEGSGHAEGS